MLMAVRDIRHLPVVDDEGVLGVVSERDLRLAQLASAGVSVPSAGAVCRREPYIVSAETPVAEVTDEMAERKIDCVLIGDDNGELAGLFTTADACRLVTMLLTDLELKKNPLPNK